MALGFALYVAASPVLQSTQDGLPHDTVRPIVTAVSTATSVSAMPVHSPVAVVMENTLRGMANTIVAGPDYTGPAPKLWEFVKRTPSAERPVPPEQKTDEA